MMKLKFIVEPLEGVQWQDALIECTSVEEGFEKYLLKHSIDLVQKLMTGYAEMTGDSTISGFVGLVRAILFISSMAEDGDPVRYLQEHKRILLPGGFPTGDMSEEEMLEIPSIVLTDPDSGFMDTVDWDSPAAWMLEYRYHVTTIMGEHLVQIMDASNN